MMLNFNQIFLGMRVKNSSHKDATVYMVKRIDTESEQFYIVPLDMSYCGEWVSGNGLFN